MALGGKVDHNVGVLFLKELIHRGPIADIRLDEAELRIFHGLSQSLQVARIGQLVQADDAVSSGCSCSSR